MSRLILLKGPHDLIDEIIGTMDISKNDFSDELIIFPGKRPPHFLKKALAVKKNAPVIPPVCYSMDIFIDILYYEHLKRKNKPIGTCDAVSVLHDLYLQQCPVKLSADLSGTFDRFMPVGFKLLEALEELYIENIPWNKEFNAFTDEPKILKHLYRPFYEFLEQNALCTRAMKFRDTAENIAAIHLNFKRILFAGFFTLTASESVLLRHLMQRPECTIYLQHGPGIEHIIRQLGATPEEKSFSGHEPKIHLYQGADAHEEIFMLNAVLKKTEQNTLANEKNVIVLPSQENLFPLLRNGLSHFREEEYNLSLGYPLIRTPAAVFLNIILEAVSRRQGENFLAADYLALLLHPYAKNTIAEHGRTDITRVMCHTIEEEFFKDKSRIYFRIEEIENDNRLFEKISERIRYMESGMNEKSLNELLKTIHAHTLMPFLNIRNIGEFADKCLDVLTYLNDKTTASRHPFFNQFVEPLVRAIETMKGEYTGRKTFADSAAYQRLLYYYLRSESKSFSGTPVKGLQVLGLLETRNLTFERAFVLDVNEDILPPAAETDPFLPPAVRTMLKLNAPDQVQKTAAYFFYLLKQNTRELHLFYLNNDDTIRSRFIEEYIWEKQKESGQTDIEDKLIRKGIGTFRLSRKKPEPIVKDNDIGQTLLNMVFSATAIKDYLNCGLRFYYKYILKLSEKEKPDDTVDALRIGDLVHKILYRFFSGKKVLTAGLLKTDELESCIQEGFREYFGHQESGRILMIKNQVRLRLTEFIEQYQKHVPAVILELEADKTITFESYNLKGRLDRIEQRNGKLYVMDYKISYGDRVRKALENFDLNDSDKFAELVQLAVYWVICSVLYSKQPDAVVPAYLFLGEATMDKTCEVALIRTGTDPAQQFEEYKAKLKELLDQITDTAVPFLPPDERKLKEHCPRCEYRTLCGTQWIKRNY